MSILEQYVNYNGTGWTQKVTFVVAAGLFGFLSGWYNNAYWNNNQHVHLQNICWCLQRRHVIWMFQWLSITKGCPDIAIRKSTHKFLLAFHSNYVPILHCFWDIARYWWKIADLNLQNLYLAPHWGWSRWNFAEIFGISKLESLGYHIIHMALFVWY